MKISKTKINEIILKSGKKKQFIAQKLSIAPATLTRYCSGTTYPNQKILAKLAKILDVDISEFFLSNNNTNM
jgi:transcriptional regulator with XRE-family HTH domain